MNTACTSFVLILSLSFTIDTCMAQPTPNNTDLLPNSTLHYEYNNICNITGSGSDPNNGTYTCTDYSTADNPESYCCSLLEYIRVWLVDHKTNIIIGVVIAVAFIVCFLGLTYCPGGFVFACTCCCRSCRLVIK